MKSCISLVPISVDFASLKGCLKVLEVEELSTFPVVLDGRANGLVAFIGEDTSTNVFGGALKLPVGLVDGDVWTPPEARLAALWDRELCPGMEGILKELFVCSTPSIPSADVILAYVKSRPGQPSNYQV